MTRRAADGSVDAANTITDLPVTVFANASAQPASPVEMVTKLVAALNEAVRSATAESLKLAGTVIEGAVFESGTLLRLRVAPPAAEVGTVRLHDATVTISDPTAGAGIASFLTTYGMDAAAAVANPSRYRLGQPYTNGPID